MVSEIIVRAGKPSDYPGFKRMEEKAWEGTGIDIISEEMYLTWLDVFPDGLRLAEINGEICGHLYGQICDFDPLDETDARDLDIMTDHMYTQKTHNPQGNCVYTFSVSATHGASLIPMNNHFKELTKRLSKQYYSGVVRMDGLDRYARKHGIERLKFDDVDKYASSVNATMQRKTNGAGKIFDPVVSPLLKVGNIRWARVIENFFPFAGAQSWGCVLYWSNNDV